MLKQILSLLLLTAITATTAISQDVSLRLAESTMKIEGTSNVRDWHANVNTVNVSMILADVSEHTLTNLTPSNFKTLYVEVPVKDIQSDTRGLTGNIHSYLKSDRNPNITFLLSEITSIDIDDNGVASIVANGVINAAGVNSEVSMTVNAVQSSSNGIRFYGVQDLKMTSFSITPPTAVMGTIRARDEFKVSFSITLRK